MQQFGLELLILADGWKAGEDREEDLVERLKLALVAAGRDPVDLWPEPAPDSYEGFDPAVDEGRDFDYSAVDWQGGSAAEWERMQEALGQSRVQVPGGRDEEIDEPPVPDMGDEFDREWQ